jgi:valyl-tRNA synthetase
MPPVYRPQEVESEIYRRWLEADVFAPDGAGSRPQPDREPFTIIQPPPNVTGALHIGHALTSTVEDLMIRRARMQGHPTLFLPGVDHAGISAQFVFDRIIAAEGATRDSLGRERYLERMRQFVEETRHTIADQQRRLGISVDWGRLRFTLDEGSARAVRVAFKKLYDDGLAYRGEQLINWCPTDQTSLSDLEVLATPMTGTLWYVRYHFVGDDGEPLPDDTITVATTRPETILGDTAVAVHPGDPRYATALGRHVLIPFVDRIVPVIADDVVQREFGTGAVKITPAHDAEDFATGNRHDLPLIDVMTDDGRINAKGGPYAGLTRDEARQRIVAELQARGDLEKAVAHEMVVGRCQRSDDIVEPRLKTQWFINVKPLAEKAMAAVREGRTTFVPSRFTKVFFDWMENIHDWNVSRQLWWGHRIPAWYCPDGHITVSDDADGPDSCSACGRTAAELRQEEDIFDTWFSSGLWPFSTLGWPEQTADLDRYYPTTFMETGYDIIFFWIARMMMLGEWLTGQEPFRTVYLHGMVRDPYGGKMSKTKGNVVDPLSAIFETGADALRFALINGSAAGADQRMGATRLEGARNFANKLWNAARFVVSTRPDSVAHGELQAPPNADLGPAEHWILERCSKTVSAVDRAYAEFQFGEAARLLYDAIWSDYCDWYLELAKSTLGSAGETPERKRATWQTLTWVLDTYLRLLHPIMPHVTEEIWRHIPHRADDPELLIVARWPQTADSGLADERVAGAVSDLIELTGAIRTARAESGIAAGDWLPALLWLPDADMRAAFEPLSLALSRLARIRPRLVDSRDELDTDPEASTGLAVIATNAETRLGRSSADRERERERLAKELRNAESQLQGVETRLADASFTARAPAQVVEQARRRGTELSELVTALRARLEGDR